MIRATYFLTERDLYEAQLWHGGWLQRGLQALGALLMAAGAGALIMGRYSSAVVPILVGALAVFRLRLSTRLTYGRDSVGLTETEFAASDSGVKLLNSRGNNDLDWSAFLRYTETKRLFMLYQGPHLFNIVPKRALAAEDSSQLRDLLQRHLGVRSAVHK